MTPPPDDYTAATTHAAFFDTSLAGKLLLTGPDAPQFLHNLCTNDVQSLPLGGGCEAYLCDPRGKVQFAVWISHVRLADGRHALWIETTPGRSEALVRYLDRYLISEQVEIQDVSERFGQFHLAGPAAADILGRAIGSPVPELPEFAHMERTIGPAIGPPDSLAVTCNIRRFDRLGLPGFDLILRHELTPAVATTLHAAGATPGRPETYEVLRIEAGLPLFGSDIDENRFVMEVARASRAVSYSKGCFPGQEPIVMARDRAGHVNRSFQGLKVLEGGPLPPGTKLYRDGQEVGIVTSACHSPRAGAPVALAYIRWKHEQPGTRLEADTGHGRQPVVVVGLPPVGRVATPHPA